MDCDRSISRARNSFEDVKSYPTRINEESRDSLPKRVISFNKGYIGGTLGTTEDTCSDMGKPVPCETDSSDPVLRLMDPSQGSSELEGSDQMGLGQPNPEWNGSNSPLRSYKEIYPDPCGLRGRE